LAGNGSKVHEGAVILLEDLGGTNHGNNSGEQQGEGSHFHRQQKHKL
jgi:hypothetical protein